MRKTLIALFAVPALVLSSNAFAAGSNFVATNTSQSASVTIAPYVSLNLTTTVAPSFDFSSIGTGAATYAGAAATFTNYRAWIDDDALNTQPAVFAPTTATTTAPTTIKVRGNTKQWGLTVSAAYVGTAPTTNILEGGLKVKVNSTGTYNPAFGPTTTTSQNGRTIFYASAKDDISVYYTLTLSIATFDFSSVAAITESATMTYTLTGF